MIDLDKAELIGKIKKEGNKLSDLPLELINVIYEGVNSIDLAEADQDVKDEKYCLYATNIDYIWAIVAPEKVVALLRLGACDENGAPIDDKVMTIGIPRDENGELIDIRETGELDV